MKKENNKNKEEKYWDYETNLKISKEAHDEVTKLGYDYVLKKLKKYGFSNSEKLAREILSYKNREY